MNDGHYCAHISVDAIRGDPKKSMHTQRTEKTAGVKPEHVTVIRGREVNTLRSGNRHCNTREYVPCFALAQM